MIKYLTKVGVSIALIAAMTSSVSKPTEINRKIVCEDTELVLKNLSESYKEIPIIMGNNDEGNLSVITANLTTLTWTILLVEKNRACIIDSGEGFKFKLPTNL